MIAGMDRYFQIVRCFRDEDLRADRQPEFTQIDVEISFASESLVYGIVEGAIVAMFRAAGHEVAVPFPRISYDDAMLKYGSHVTHASMVPPPKAKLASAAPSETLWMSPRSRPCCSSAAAM